MNAINLKTFARRMWFENMRIECALRRFQCIEVHTNKSSGNLTESERNRIFFFLNDATNDWIDVVIVHPPIYDAISLRLCTLAYIRSKWSKYSPFMYKLLFFPIQFDLHAPNSRIIQIFPQTVVYLKPDAEAEGGGRMENIKWLSHVGAFDLFTSKSIWTHTVHSDFHNQFYYEFDFIRFGGYDTQKLNISSLQIQWFYTLIINCSV